MVKLTFESVNSKLGKTGDPAALREISLPNKQIDDLGSFAKFTNLRVLDLRNNRLRFKRNIEGLFQAPALQILDLRGNPVCNEPGYRQYVIQNMPQLIKLDDVTITEEERRTFGVSQSNTQSFVKHPLEQEHPLATSPSNQIQPNVSTNILTAEFKTNVLMDDSKIETKKSEIKEEPKKSEIKSQEMNKTETKPETKKEESKQIEAQNQEQKKTEPKKQEIKEEPKKQEVKEESKKQEVKEEPKKETPKKEEPKKQEVKEEPKKETPKKEPKKQEVKEESKKEAPKKEEPKKQEIKEEPKKFETKPHEQKKTEPKKEEPKKESVKKTEERKESKINTNSKKSTKATSSTKSRTAKTQSHSKPVPRDPTVVFVDSRTGLEIRNFSAHSEIQAAQPPQQIETEKTTPKFTEESLFGPVSLLNESETQVPSIDNKLIQIEESFDVEKVNVAQQATSMASNNKVEASITNEDDDLFALINKVNLKSATTTTTTTTTPNKGKNDNDDDDLFALVDVKKENKDLLPDEDKKQLLNIEEYIAQQKESDDKDEENLFN